MTKRQSLGTGLDALLSATQAPKVPIMEDTPLRNVAIDALRPGPYQPRKHMNKEKLEELASSIRSQGIIQPILVRKTDQSGYEIIAGERRWRAAQLVGLKQIPVILRDLQDDQVVAVSLIENIQRQELNPIEEAEALQKLIEDFSLSHEKAGEAVGRSREAVSNMIRLLDLSLEVRQMVVLGQLMMGHARALLGLSDKRQAMPLALRVYQESLSVRTIEKLVKSQNQKQQKATGLDAVSQDPDLAILEREISEALGVRASLKQGKKGGTLTIRFFGNDELEGIINKIKGNPYD
jgi:ParB family transcriptional regulator, chromosome partitioning protein